MLKVTIKTPEQHHWRRSVVFNVNFGHVSQQFLVFLLLNLNKQMLARAVTCLIVMKVKWKLVFNKRIFRSLFQVVNFYLTSTVRSVTQNKKYFFILHFLPLFTFDPFREKTTNWAISRYFHVISIATQDWTVLRILSPILPLLHQINWF